MILVMLWSLLTLTGLPVTELAPDLFPSPGFSAMMLMSSQILSSLCLSSLLVTCFTGRAGGVL